MTKLSETEGVAVEKIHYFLFSEPVSTSILYSINTLHPFQSHPPTASLIVEISF